MNNILKRLGLVGFFSQSQQKVGQSSPQSSSPVSNPRPNDYAYGAANNSTDNKFKFSKKIKRIFRNSTYLPFVLIGLIVIAIISIAIFSLPKSQPKSVAGTTDNKITIPNAKATEQLNKEFLFPLKDDNKKEISKLIYTIQNAELRDEIIIKGQKATAVEGRTFVVLNLKITNNYNKSININARDYIRLIINNSSEKLAPDIHNDPVEVQAISTKLTRVGFPVNDTDKNLTLQVGEIDGKKELIKLNLK